MTPESGSAAHIQPGEAGFRFSDKSWMAAVRATGAIVPPEVACRCEDFGFCARGDDGGDRICRHCTQRIDVAYDPCPIFGFGCGPGCDCCTPAQQEATRANA